MNNTTQKDRQKKKVTNIGIVGVGDVVYKSHLPTLLAMNDISVAWVTDRDHNRAEQVARSYRVKCLRLPEQLTALPYTDIALLAIPYGARAPYYEVLRHRGSALYVEKPISRSADEHRQLCSLFSPSRLAVGLQRRSWGPVVLLKKLVDESVFGRLVRVELKYGGSAIVTSGKPFVSDAKLAGGGVLFEHGIHGLDMVLYISGAGRAHSYQVKTIIEKGFDVHAEGQVTLTNVSNEFVMDFKISWLSEMAEGLTFIFDHAVVNMSVREPRILIKSHEGRVLMSLTSSDIIYPITGFQTLWEYWASFLTAVQSGTANHTSADTSLLTTELIEQIYTQGGRQ
ncbi:MAG: Gfo/Idh/MocA family oxidoreductase [Candidatus Omnitrophica bacterium]|nr:Gfo/Idh/MocA family oxidoreductase [Candidatus Omnitrophota bacterium]MBU4478991.1 Gfo/Idh/MocA family oxidoreductase [Candidatus Omnitrophota bacterium]